MWPASHSPITANQGRDTMNSIFWLIGVIVVVLAVLSLIGLR